MARRRIDAVERTAYHSLQYVHAGATMRAGLLAPQGGLGLDAVGQCRDARVHALGLLTPQSGLVPQPGYIRGGTEKGSETLSGHQHSQQVCTSVCSNYDNFMTYMFRTRSHLALSSPCRAVGCGAPGRPRPRRGPSAPRRSQARRAWRRPTPVTRVR